MRHLLAVAAVVLSLTSIAASQGPILGLRSYTDPVVDGVIGADEWEHPETDSFSVLTPGTEVTDGTFSGQDDARLETTVLFSATDLFVAVRVHDENPLDDDTVLLEIGSAQIEIERDGDVSSNVTLGASAVTGLADGFVVELRVPLSVVTPGPTAELTVTMGVGYEDEDPADSGTLMRAPVGAGLLLFVSPVVDLTNAAAMLDSAALDPEAEGKPAKQADRLEKAAREKDWTDDYLPASRSSASKSLDRVRKTAKKVGKTQAKLSGEPFAGLLEEPQNLMERAARLTAAVLLREAIQQAGRTESAGAIEKWDAAEASTGTVADRIKLYRKAAKKAAKLAF